MWELKNNLKRYLQISKLNVKYKKKNNMENFFYTTKKRKKEKKQMTENAKTFERVHTYIYIIKRKKYK